MSEENNNRRKNGLIFFLLGFSCLAVYLLLLQHKGAKEKEADLLGVVSALSDTIARKTDALGRETAYKKVIQLAYSDLKKIHTGDSSEIQRLKNLVKSGTVSATVVSSSTTNTVTGTTTIIKYDTISGDTVFPVYASKVKTKWEEIETTASKDTTRVKYKAFNIFSISQQWTKEGRWPLRKEVLTVGVTNENPNTVTSGLSSFHIPQKKPRKFRNFSIGFGVGLISGLVLLQQFK